MGFRGWVAALLLVSVACGDEASHPLDDEARGGKKAPLSAEAIADGGSGGSVVPATVVDIPVKQPTFEIDRVDPTRYVIGADVLTQIAAEVASGKVTTRKVGTGYKLGTLGESAVLGKLGLMDADVVVTINGKPLAPAGLEMVHATVRVNGYAKVSVLRNGVTVKRRYVLRSSLEKDDDTSRSYLRSGPRIKAKDDFERLIAAMRVGVKVGDKVTQVDRAVLEVIGSNYEMLRYGQRYSYGSKTRGIHVSDANSAYGVLGLTRYDVIKAVGTTDTFYRRKFKDAILNHAATSQFSISVVRLAEPTVLRYEVVTGLVADTAALKALSENWRNKVKVDDPYGSLGAYGSLTRKSGTGTGSFGGLSSNPYVSSSTVRRLFAAVERTQKKLGEFKYQVGAKPLRALVKEPGALMKGVRLLPSYRNDGLKIYGLISTSPLSLLGFKSLDTIGSVNGKKLRTNDDISVLTKALNSKRRLKIGITRRYQKKTLVLIIK